MKIDGIDNLQGNLHCAIYTKDDPFPDMKRNFKFQIVNAKNTEIRFDGLKADLYAIAIFHDENKNGKLDKNMFGVPTEKYGFSNNVRGVFSAPSFSAASFYLKTQKTLNITLK